MGNQVAKKSSEVRLDFKSDDGYLILEIGHKEVAADPR